MTTETQQTENEAAVGLSELTEVLDLVSRLRAGEPESTNEAADFIEQTIGWICDGEEIVGRGTRFALFSLGVWWADRPWRKRNV